MAKNVMVTGGLGMVGAVACRSLLLEGFRPVIYDIGSSTALVQDIAKDCIIEHGDVTDLPRMMALVSDLEISSIVHLAGKIGPGVEEFPWSSFHANLLGTTTVLECARLRDVTRIVFSSSKMVYGPVGEKHRHPAYVPLPEEHPREPLKFYGKLKRACEDVADHYVSRYGLDVIALRFGSSISPGKFGRHSKVSPVVDMLEAAIANRPFRLEQGADQCDDLCYAGESANGILAALNSPLRPGVFRAYNIAAGELLSLQQMADALMQIHPQWKCEVGPGLDYRKIGPGYYFRMDISKAERELNFRPRFPFRNAAIDYEKTLKRLSGR
jgi:UDP-glucose 4-epimerase